MGGITVKDVQELASGFDEDPTRSLSLQAPAYTESKWLEADQAAIFARSWQWICHVERLAAPGSYVTAVIAGMPVVAVRDRAGALRAFYNVWRTSSSRAPGLPATWSVRITPGPMIWTVD